MYGDRQLVDFYRQLTVSLKSVTQYCSPKNTFILSILKHFHATQIVIQPEFYTFEQQAVSVLAFSDMARQSRTGG